MAWGHLPPFSMHCQSNSEKSKLNKEESQSASRGKDNGGKVSIDEAKLASLEN